MPALRLIRLPQIIHLSVQAPPKPEVGAACNGCGVCCAAATCPVARLFLRQRQAPCRALQWDAAAQRYHCGMMLAPAHYLPGLPRALDAVFRRCIRRWIAAGQGCDSQVEVEVNVCGERNFCSRSESQQL